MKITNIGILNIQNASEETLEKCQEISNVGFMIGTDLAFEQIQPCRISDVGMTMQIPVGVPSVFQEDDLVLDDDFLNSLPKKTVFLVNGDCLIQTQNTQLLQEKIHEMVINGNTYCSTSIKGLLSTLGRFNGRLVAFENGARFFKETLHMNESLLFRLPKKVSTNQLRALDPKLLASLEAFDSIEVMDSCWLERGLFSAWKEKLHLDFSAELQLLEAPIRYYESDETLKASRLDAITEHTIAVDGTLTIMGEELASLNGLSAICCKTLRARESVIDALKPLLMPGTKVETLESNTRINHGKLILSAVQLAEMKNPMRIKNYAGLVFDQSVTPDHVNKGIAQIENYGVIRGPEILMTAIADKTVKNYGKIKPTEVIKVKNEKEYAYENLGYLAL